MANFGLWPKSKQNHKENTVQQEPKKERKKKKGKG